MKISFHLFSNTSAWRDGPIIIQTCQKNLFALQQKSISPIPTAIKHTEIPHEIGDQLNLLLYLYIYFYLKLVFVFVTIHPLYFLECPFCVPWKLSLFCHQGRCKTGQHSTLKKWGVEHFNIFIGLSEIPNSHQDVKYSKLKKPVLKKFTLSLLKVKFKIDARTKSNYKRSIRNIHLSVH